MRELVAQRNCLVHDQQHFRASDLQGLVTAGRVHSQGHGFELEESGVEF